jgi:tRNA uridine 5-carboxymethylaminomethyl modification enzyme
LTPQGRALGLVDDQRWEFFERKMSAVSQEVMRLQGALVRAGSAGDALSAKLGQPLARETYALELLRRPELNFDDVDAASGAPSSAEGAAPVDWRSDERLFAQVKTQVEVTAKYEGYLKRQEQEIDRQRRNEHLTLPRDLNYFEVAGLSNEARQRLHEVRPETLGQAGRIPGLTPAALSLLLVHLKKRAHAA